MKADSFTPTLTHPKYRPDIDGLRAIAVLSVVIFHVFLSTLPLEPGHKREYTPATSSELLKTANC